MSWTIPALRGRFEAYILACNNNDLKAIERDRVGDYKAHGVHCAWEAVSHFAASHNAQPCIECLDPKCQGNCGTDTGAHQHYYGGW